jgi:hypothetical protein
MKKRDNLSPGNMGPTIIDKGQPIEPIGSRLRDQTRTFDSGVRAPYQEKDITAMSQPASTPISPETLPTIQSNCSEAVCLATRIFAIGLPQYRDLC